MVVNGVPGAHQQPAGPAAAPAPLAAAARPPLAAAPLPVPVPLPQPAPAAVPLREQIRSVLMRVAPDGSNDQQARERAARGPGPGGPAATRGALGTRRDAGGRRPGLPRPHRVPGAAVGVGPRCGSRDAPPRGALARRPSCRAPGPPPHSPRAAAAAAAAAAAGGQRAVGAAAGGGAAAAGRPRGVCQGHAGGVCRGVPGGGVRPRPAGGAARLGAPGACAAGCRAGRGAAPRCSERRGCFVRRGRGWGSRAQTPRPGHAGLRPPAPAPRCRPTSPAPGRPRRRCLCACWRRCRRSPTAATSRRSSSARPWGRRGARGGGAIQMAGLPEAPAAAAAVSGRERAKSAAAPPSPRSLAPTGDEEARRGRAARELHAAGRGVRHAGVAGAGRQL
jgi:hypothetical protein